MSNPSMLHVASGDKQSIAASAIAAAGSTEAASTGSFPQLELFRSQSGSKIRKAAHTMYDRRGNEQRQQGLRASEPSPLSKAVHYTVLIRLSFPRNGFVDPPAVDWDTSKDDALWKILSRTSNGREIHWKELARGFEVPLPFLFQQVAWLYERQLSQVRAQMRKVGNPTQSSLAPAETSASGVRSGVAQTAKRRGSGGAGSRIPSSLSVRSRESPARRGDTSHPSTPTRAQAPPMSRTSSASTAVQSRYAGLSGSRRPSILSRPSANAAPSRSALDPAKDQQKEVQPAEHPPEPSPISEDNSNSGSSDEDHGPSTTHLKSQAWKRPSPRPSRKRASGPYRSNADEDDEDDDDEDEDSPAFLPFSSRVSNPQPQDASSTLRYGSSRYAARHMRRAQTTASNRSRTAPDAPLSTSSASSATSSQAAAPSDTSSQRQQGGSRPAGPLSPRRAAELAGKSPRRKNAKDGSDGTPSMGSSFSDLDDTSVTQSALEEALLSNMQHGGVASRMSTISQALKSRYL